MALNNPIDIDLKNASIDILMGTNRMLSGDAIGGNNFIRSVTAKTAAGLLLRNPISPIANNLKSSRDISQLAKLLIARGKIL